MSVGWLRELLRINQCADIQCFVSRRYKVLALIRVAHASCLGFRSYEDYEDEGMKFSYGKEYN